ncbi:hypothetical protein YC2023_072753 [Brassica napus]
MKKTIERYRKYTRDHETSSHNSEIYIQVFFRKLLGQELASCSLEELQEIDSQLQISLGKVRARKSLSSFRYKLEQGFIAVVWRHIPINLL